MDPVTQAAVGAAAAQSKSPLTSVKQAAFVGALAGMAPDLDILIRSSHDPLLALEFHRHFTHSLLFIPFGAGLCALFFYYLLNRWWKLKFGVIYLWSVLGYASHGLLDGCTTYGTQLLWPLSDTRIAWNTIAVVDPLFTLPLILTVILTIKRKDKRWWFTGAVWCLSYLAVGMIQNERAVSAAATLADSRGHDDAKIVAKPSFANIVVWKTVYEYQGYFYVDAVRPGLAKSRHWEGGRIEKLNIASHLPWLSVDSQQAQDIARFRHFSSGYIGVDPDNAYKIIDIRYSLLPHQIDPLWGIVLDPEAAPQQHVGYYTQRDNTNEAIKTLISMIFE